MQWGIASPAQLEEWRIAINADVVDAVERARNAPWPAVDTLFDLV
jgi:TPP-dependent pyruvate/acetoin dehydrogenase alpha subunit